MPRLKYRPRDDIPRAARELRSLSPSLIVDWILSRYNIERDASSITKWLTRHPDVREELEEEIIKEQVPEAVVDARIFSTGAFETFECVNDWIKEMKSRDVVKWKPMVNYLKNVCLGVRPQMNPETGHVWRRVDKGPKGIDLRKHGWVMKHPKRLTLKDVQEYINLMKEHYPKIDTSSERAATRGFLMSKGIVVGKKISGKKHKSAGSLAQLFVEKDVIFDMMDWVKTQDYEAYVIDRFMWETGTRIEATVSAQIQNLTREGDYMELLVHDKGRRDKYPIGHPWHKVLSEELYEEILLVCDYPRKTTGNIFTKTDDDMSPVNKEAILKFCPEIIHQRGPEFAPYEDWNHFWRHMFFQHMLRMTGWNYAVAAGLGGCTVKSLEESYGMPPRALVRKWGLEQLPRLRIR